MSIKFFLSLFSLVNFIAFINAETSLRNDSLVALYHYHKSDSLYLFPELSLSHANKALPLLYKTKQFEKYVYILNTKSYSFQSMERFDSMEFNNLFAFNEASRLLPQDHVYYLGAINNLARVYQLKGDYASAIRLYREALKEINVSSESVNADLIGTLYENVALIYREKIDYKTAVEYFLQAIKYHEIHYEKNMSVASKGHIKIAKVHQFIGSCYRYIHQYSKSLNHLDKSKSEFDQLENLSTNHYSYLYREYSYLFIGLKDPINAKLYANNSLRNLQNLPLLKTSVEELLGDIAAMHGNAYSSVQSYESSLESCPKRQTHTLGRLHRKISHQYAELGHQKLASQHLDSAFQILEAQEFEQSIHQPGDIDNYPLVELIDCYKEKAWQSHRLYESSGDIQHLLKSMEAYQLMVNAMNGILTSLYSDQSKWIFLRKSKSYISEAISSSIDLAKVAPELGTMWTHFFIDHGKSILLNLERIQMEALRSEGQSDLVVAKKTLEKDIRGLESLIEKVRRDSTYLQELRSELFSKKQEYIRLLTDHQMDHLPSSTKYADFTTFSSSIHNLLDDQSAIINYFQGDEYLYWVYLDSDTTYLEKNPLTDLNSDFSKSGLSQFVVKADQESSIKISNFLEDVSPAHIGQNIEKLIISPDEKLWTLPYDLMYHPYANSSMIHSVNISYAHSITSLMDQNPTSKSWIESGLFAQVPLRSESSNSYHEEFDLLNSYFTELLRGKDASKENFLNAAQDKDLLYISSHAFGDQDSILPFISFSDTSLNLNEIYGMHLNNTLTVISACNVERGRVISGEGLQSLSRAFAAAGSSAILSSLWQLDERATFQIVESFLQNIKSGLSKSAALRAAKLAYLKNASSDLKKHPYYWAGIVLVGNDDPVLFNSSQPLYWIIIAVATLILLLIYSIKRYTDRRI